MLSSASPSPFNLRSSTMFLIRLLHTVALAAALSAAPAATQPSRASSCKALLDAAEGHYQQQEYEALEPLVLSCIYDPAATPDETSGAYRLLALSYVNRGSIADARATIARLLTGMPEYRADLALDLPLYVSLVESVRVQMTTPSPPPAPGRPVLQDGPIPAAATTTAPVDVNTATAEELDRVPGIGPALAGRIIDYRAAHGRFGSVADLEAVRGIGPQSLVRMAPFLVAGSGRAVAAAVPAAVPAAGTAAAPAAGTAAAPAAAPAAVPAAVVDARPKVNLNTASAEELTVLNGIGPALALRIVEYREAYGPFRTVEDVTNVRGIGPAKLEALAGQATVE